MFPVLHIGPVAIQAPGLMLLLGFYLGVTLFEHFSRRRGENPDNLTNLVFIAGLAGIVAARLSYAGVHVAIFQKNPIGLLSPDTSLLDPWGGIAGAFIAALVYGQRKHLEFWAILDRLAPFLAVLAVFFGLAHMASGQAFGSPTALPWAIELWGTRRHPSQIYETVGGAAILLLLWKQFGSPGVPGTVFLKFTALVSALTVFLSAFRGDSILELGSFRQEQLFALFILGIALLLLEIRSGSGKLIRFLPKDY